MGLLDSILGGGDGLSSLLGAGSPQPDANSGSQAASLPPVTSLLDASTPVSGANGSTSGAPQASGVFGAGMSPDELERMKRLMPLFSALGMSLMNAPRNDPFKGVAPSASALLRAQLGQASKATAAPTSIGVQDFGLGMQSPQGTFI